MINFRLIRNFTFCYYSSKSIGISSICIIYHKLYNIYFFILPINWDDHQDKKIPIYLLINSFFIMAFLLWLRALAKHTPTCLIISVITPSIMFIGTTERQRTRHRILHWWEGPVRTSRLPPWTFQSRRNGKRGNGCQWASCLRAPSERRSHDGPALAKGKSRTRTENGKVPCGRCVCVCFYSLWLCIVT